MFIRFSVIHSYSMLFRSSAMRYTYVRMNSGERVGSAACDRDGIERWSCQG